MTIGEMIRELRISKKITQKTLSELSGVAEITIRQYESGKRQPRINQLEKISKSFDIPVSYFLEMTRPKTTNTDRFHHVIELLNQFGFGLYQSYDDNLKNVYQVLDSNNKCLCVMTEIEITKILEKIETDAENRKTKYIRQRLLLELVDN